MRRSHVNTDTLPGPGLYLRFDLADVADVPHSLQSRRIVAALILPSNGRCSRIRMFLILEKYAVLSETVKPD